MFGGIPVDQKINGYDLKARRPALAYRREVDGAPLCSRCGEQFDRPVSRPGLIWPHGARCVACRRVLVPAVSKSPSDI